MRRDFRELAARDSIYAYLRTSGNNRVLVILNGSERPREFKMPIGDRRWTDCELEDLIAGGVVKRSGAEGPITLAAFGGRVLKLK